MFASKNRNFLRKNSDLLIEGVYCISKLCLSACCYIYRKVCVTNKLYELGIIAKRQNKKDESFESTVNLILWFTKKCFVS